MAPAPALPLALTSSFWDCAWFLHFSLPPGISSLWHNCVLLIQVSPQQLTLRRCPRILNKQVKRVNLKKQDMAFQMSEKEQWLVGQVKATSGESAGPPCPSTLEPGTGIACSPGDWTEKHPTCLGWQPEPNRNQLLELVGVPLCTWARVHFTCRMSKSTCMHFLL